MVDMSMFGTGPTNVGGANYWNYSNTQKDNYSLSVWGDVVEIAITYKVFEGKISRNSKGNPIEQFEITLAQDDGNEYTWGNIGKGSWKNVGSKQAPVWNWVPSQAMAACDAALTAYGQQAGNLGNLQGLRIQVETDADPVLADGRVVPYGLGNPRPFRCRILGQGTHPFRGFVDKRNDNEGPSNNGGAPAPMQQPPQMNGTSPEMLARINAHRDSLHTQVPQRPAQPPMQPPTMNVGGLNFQQVSGPYDQTPVSVYDNDIPFG